MCEPYAVIKVLNFVHYYILPNISIYVFDQHTLYTPCNINRYIDILLYYSCIYIRETYNIIIYMIPSRENIRGEYYIAICNITHKIVICIYIGILAHIAVVFNVS